MTELTVAQYMGDITALWGRTCTDVSVLQLNLQNKRFVLIFSLGYFSLVMAHAVSIVSINYISGISPIWFLFLTKLKPVCSYGNNFPPSSFRIILNLFAHGIYRVRSIIWQMSLSRTGLWVWTSLQESWPLISVLPFTPYIIVDKPCNFYKLQNRWP